VVVDHADLVAAPAPHVELTVAGPPDTGTYRLSVLPHVDALSPDPPLPDLPFDPLRTWLPVRLRPECPDLGGCFPPEPPVPLPSPSPVHDYLARDWRGLRSALLEFLVREDPTADLSPADPAVAVTELFAHLGDLLHYRLDRVATEAYLETARLRTSVRRHARLVDFALAEAASATTAVLVQVDPGASPVDVSAGMVAVTATGGTPFTLDAGRRCPAALGEIAVYDWGEDACCLPAGATECVLVRPRPADPLGDGWLGPGDLLAFEVVDPSDPARHRRWARRESGVDWPLAPPGFRFPLASRAAAVVELVAVEPFSDPLALAGMALYRVRWRAEERLARSYPVGIDTGAGAPEVTVARANLLPAHHGRLVDGPPAAVLRARDGGQAPAEFSLLAAGVPDHGGAGVALRPDGRPYRLEVDVTLPSGGDPLHPEVVPTLLGVPPATLAAVLDMEEHEPPVLRFRTGAVGLAPPLGSQVGARYEVGGGEAGNLPANALRVLTANAAPVGQPPELVPVDHVVARNPAPASGGRDAMPLDVARRDAPEAFAASPRRAVLAADHAATAAGLPGVQRAVARREWSGSWPLVRTVVDLLDDPDGGDADRLARLTAALDDVRMLGTEVTVVPGTPVGLLVALEVCATPGTDPEELRRRILARLRPGDAAHPGLFHPSRLTLGGRVHTSAVLAAVAGLSGVDAVELREARRLSDPPGTVHAVIEVGPSEVAVLDDDPDQPRRGRLDVRLRSGR
jgi:hypothetical protein